MFESIKRIATALERIATAYEQTTSNQKTALARQEEKGSVETEKIMKIMTDMFGGAKQ